MRISAGEIRFVPGGRCQKTQEVVYFKKDFYWLSWAAALPVFRVGSAVETLVFVKKTINNLHSTNNALFLYSIHFHLVTGVTGVKREKYSRFSSCFLTKFANKIDEFYCILGELKHFHSRTFKTFQKHITTISFSLLVPFFVFISFLYPLFSQFDFRTLFIEFTSGKAPKNTENK